MKLITTTNEMNGYAQMKKDKKDHFGQKRLFWTKKFNLDVGTVMVTLVP